MKRFVAQLNDGSYINVPADRMQARDSAFCVYDGPELVAYVDMGAVVSAYISDREGKV